MNKRDIILVVRGIGYILSIFLTIWGLMWGIPLIAESFDTIYWKIIGIILSLPFLPMLPGLFTVSYKLYEIPKVYIYEFIDMYYSVFLIVLTFPAVFVKVFFIIGVIIMISTIIILFVWVLQSTTGIIIARGLRFNDYLVYITIFNCGLIILFGARYLNDWLEAKALEIGNQTNSAIETIFSLLKKKREDNKLK